MIRGRRAHGAALATLATCAHLSPDNQARELDMHRQHVQRSIKRLIQLGIILEGVKIGISRSYRLNPSFGWKGSAKGHREALHEHLKVIK